jgi:hypothetical protein
MASILDKLGNAVKTKVEQAKATGCIIEHLDLGGTDFVYRSLNRSEWKELQTESINKAKGEEGGVLDPLRLAELKEEGEDAVVLAALIFPEHKDAKELNSYPAGYVSQLADRVTELSGFGEPEVEPVRL